MNKHVKKARANISSHSQLMICDRIFSSLDAKKNLFSYLLGLLLELLDGPLVDTTALVDQVAGGGRLAGVDVANDHDVDVNLLLNHLVGLGRS